MLEFPPQLGLRAPLLLANWFQVQKNRAVSQIRPASDTLYPVQEGGARRLEQHLCIVGVELTNRETATACKPAECIGEPGGQSGQIIECEQMPIVGGNHQFAFLAWERSDRRHIGIDQCPEELR